jgi:hypothetical protein
MTDYDPNYTPFPDPPDEEQDKQDRALANKISGVILVAVLAVISAVAYFSTALVCMAPSNHCVWPFNYGPRPLNDLHAAFKDVDDGLFAFLVGKMFSNFDSVKSALPDWAPDEVREDSTGAFTARQHVLDASWFWRTVRHFYENVRGTSVSSAIVADYGAGWGRVSRFANKDVPADQFYALEPNPGFQQIYADCRLAGRMVPIDWLSSETTSVENVDLIFSYSVLTHSSERLTKNIVDRWTEMTKPGSIVAFTIRPGFYLGENDGDMSVFTAQEHAILPERFARGEFIYKPYDGQEDWGVTILPPSYVEQLFARRFKVLKTSFQLQTTNQIIVFAQRI